MIGAYVAAALLYLGYALRLWWKSRDLRRPVLF